MQAVRIYPLPVPEMTDQSVEARQAWIREQIRVNVMEATPQGLDEAAACISAFFVQAIAAHTEAAVKEMRESRDHIKLVCEEHEEDYISTISVLRAQLAALKLVTYPTPLERELQAKLAATEGELSGLHDQIRTMDRCWARVIKEWNKMLDALTAERDHASQQAGINADLMYQAQHERDALKAEVMRVSGELDSYVIAEGGRFAAITAERDRERKTRLDVIAAAQLDINDLKAAREQARRALGAFVDSCAYPEHDDVRLDYISVQIDRDDLAQAKAVLTAAGPDK